MKYDIIGDIHGHASKLRALLEALGYRREGNVYSHPTRTVIYLGDFIDRGPEIRETLRIVKGMCDAGTAQAIQGNHEYNAVCFHTPAGKGGFLRSHTYRDGQNVRQHRATIDQLCEPYPEEWKGYLEWFKRLPFRLELPGGRFVHACWSEPALGIIGDNMLTDPVFLRSSAIKGTSEFAAVETVLKGAEMELPEGAFYLDKEGIERRSTRMRWFLDRDHSRAYTFRDLTFPDSDLMPLDKVPNTTMDTLPGYAADAPPVFFGHYWIPPATKPGLLSHNVACLDYSAASSGPLVAYRWDGEQRLDPTKFVTSFGESAPVLASAV